MIGGEGIGSSKHSSLTLQIENAGLSQEHCEIKVCFVEKYNHKEYRYELMDLNSIDGTWIKIRIETPLKIEDGTQFKLRDVQYAFTFQKMEESALLSWLARIDLARTIKYLGSQNIT